MVDIINLKDKMDVQNPTKEIRYWVQLYSDNLYTRALYKVGVKEVAEDLVQETFLAAFQSIHQFEGKSSPKTWLFAILNNKITDYYRKNSRSPAMDISQRKDTSSFFDMDGQWIKEERPAEWPEETEHLLDNAAFNDVLQTCLKKLPDNWYSAVRLKYLEEKKGNMICQELGISPTNFWQILHRAKLHLRKCLELNWFKK